jgi:Flp pilus assembly protein TadB
LPKQKKTYKKEVPMRYLLSFVIGTLFILTGCQESTTNHSKIHLLNSPTPKEGVNPNSLAYVSADKALERQNKVELSKIEAKAKIEIEKIKSQNQLHIAKINAEAQKSIAHTDYKAKVETSQIDASTHKESMQYAVYIVIAVIVLLIVALFIYYQNNKKNRELEKQLHDEQLRHEQFLKEKELEEQRVHKLLELIASGKVAKNVEKEVILSIAKPKKDDGEDIIIEKKD